MDLDAVVAHGRETTTVDFKERLNWHAGRGGRLEVLRDIVGLANREGGAVVIGVQESANGRFTPIGLQEDDLLPDGTEVGGLLRQYFDPSIPVAVGTRQVAGVSLGVIDVPAFSTSPLIAVKDGNDSSGRSIINDGDLLIRTDALSIEKIKGRDLRNLLDRALTTRATQLNAVLPPPTPAGAPSQSWGESVSGSRLLELIPSPGPPSRPLREIESLVKEARIVSRFGMTVMPSDIDFGGSSRIIRETGRLIAYASGFGSAADRETEELTFIEADRHVGVRVRETPWERRPPDSPVPIDVTGLFVFAMSGLHFGVRLYRAADTPQFDYRIGIATPAGHRLTVAVPQFNPLFTAYLGTSRSTIWVQRRCTVTALDSEEARVEVGRDVLDELLYFFGFELTPAVFDAHVDHIRGYGGVPL